MSEVSRYAVSQKVSIITLIANLIFAVIKMFVGTVFRSHALVADGLHSASDAVSTITVMVGNRISKEPPDDEHPYGHGKAEPIATKVLGILLVIGGLIILKETIHAILVGDISVPSKLVLWTALASILVKELMYHYTYRAGKKVNNRALIADAIHHRTDAFSSIAVLIGAGGARLGYPILDPIAGLIVALFILKMGVEVFKDAANELMDAAPNEEKFKEIIDVVETIDQVIKIRNLKIRTHGPNYFVDIRVVVNNELTVVEGHEVAVGVRRKIQECCDDIQEVLVHIDPKGIQHIESGYINSNEI